jgi:hypothetical protein
MRPRIVIQNGVIIHPQNRSDVGRNRQRDPLDLEAMIVLPRLFQSHTQAGAASAVVVDEDPGDPARLAACEKSSKRLARLLADLDHDCAFEAAAPLGAR